MWQQWRETSCSFAPTETITYTNDTLGLPQALLADDGIAQTAQLYGLDLIGQDDGTGMRTLLTDGLVSVRQELADGAVQTATTYDPYGRLLAQTGTSGTVYGYTGEQEDAATGLVYLRARYYNPNTNHFLTRDPYPGSAKMPASQNGYSYVHGNPINYTDPTGYCIELVSGAICVGTGIIVVGTVAIVGGTVIVVNNIVNDRPALDFSGLPPAPDWMVDNFYLGDDIENFPEVEDWSFVESWPWEQQTVKAPTGIEKVDEPCFLEQLLPPDPGLPFVWPGPVKQEVGIQILLSAQNRASFEAYTAELRRQMGKPYVNDPDLQRIMSRLYRENATVGSGSTADAIRFENETGLPVGGSFHTKKGEDSIRNLERWLENHPNASPGDKAAAENVIKDLTDALGQ